MDRSEREQVRAAYNAVSRWVNVAVSLGEQRSATEGAAHEALAELRGRMRPLRRDETLAWRVLPGLDADDQVVQRLSELRNLPTLTANDRALLDQLEGPAALACADGRRLLTARRFFTSRAKRETGNDAAAYLRQFHAWGEQAHVAFRLQALRNVPRIVGPGGPSGRDLLDPRLRLADELTTLGRDPRWLGQQEIGRLPGALDLIARAVSEEAPRRSAARQAAEAVRTADARRLLAEMPLSALKEATANRLRFGPLEKAGYLNVLDVLDRRGNLQAVPGVGEKTAAAIEGAARTIWRVTYNEMPARIDVKTHPQEATVLLRKLAEWEATRRTTGAAVDIKRAEELRELGKAYEPAHRVLIFVTHRQPVDILLESVERIVARAEVIQRSTASLHASVKGDPWTDFLSRPADYFTLLAELGFNVENEQSAHGNLPDELVQAVRGQELRTEHLKGSLRGYQDFGARFALVQKKVLIGDEMGLGKTFEAIAVLAHLRAKGEQHFLVVCPAAVLTNWTREVQTRSVLAARRLHGSEREQSLKTWQRHGGVGVTTFDSLAWLGPRMIGVDPACIVVDEAHYIKNPDAKRSQRTSRLVTAADRAVFLTGTPLENRVGEFRTLVRYLRPDLLVDENDITPRRFRRQVAPAYLRRNQEDVLTEIPELVEVEEWLPMSFEDSAAYRNAVLESNFMAMRQAAMLATNSVKLQRLVEIVAEAEENDRRVVVFSHFRAVLTRVADALPGRVFGPISGSVAPDERQRIIDEFSHARSGAVLVAQIVAGGVGLNIQAASVVVICEPQLKPTTESQAIARAHRIGQALSVQVHRLLTEDSADERIVEILAHKRRIFEEFARISETAESTPEAVDITEAQLARDVVAAERQRLMSGPSAAAPFAE